MNSQEFVVALRTVACDKASAGIIEIIRNPPGRNPDLALVDLSKWFNGLGPNDKAMVERLASLSTRQAVYNVLLVLDGLLAVSPKGNQLDFELLAKENGSCELLNSPAEVPLSHWFKEE